MADTQTAPAQNGHRRGSEHELRNYTFPTKRLTLKLNEKDKGRKPLVLCACGSFSPITYLHLRMFEMARDWARLNTSYAVVGAYLSPVGDAYKKKGLAPAADRVNMCELAVSTIEPYFVMVDQWEAAQSEYQPTAKVLDHLDQEINKKLGGVDDGTGHKVPVQIALLGGADLIETFSQPGVWAEADLRHILCDYGAFVLERQGTDLPDALSKLDQEWKQHIYVIHQTIQNDVSSTKIRAFLDEQLSIRYLVPEPVIRYIDDHNLYTNGRSAPAQIAQHQPPPAEVKATSD